MDMNGDLKKVRICGARTVIDAESVKLFWEIKDWKLCKPLATNKSFESPPFQVSDTVWKIRMCATTGARKNNIQAQLVLEKSSNDLILITGTLKIDGVVENEFDEVLSTSKEKSQSMKKQPQLSNKPAVRLHDTFGELFALPTPNCGSNTKTVPSQPFSGFQYENTNHSMVVSQNSNKKDDDICNFIATTWKSTHDIKQENLNVVAKFKFSFGDPETERLETASSECKTSGNNDADIQLNRLSEDLTSLLIDDSVSDMTITINGTIVKAHGILFSARSPVFKEMIKKAINKRRSMDFHVKCPNIRIWNEFQQFVYTGKTSINNEELLTLSQDLVPFAREYQVSSLIDYLTNRLLSYLNYHNTLDMLELAYQCNLPVLQRESNEVLMRNFNEVKMKDYDKLVSVAQKYAEITVMMVNR